MHLCRVSCILSMLLVSTLCVDCLGYMLCSIWSGGELWNSVYLLCSGFSIFSHFICCGFACNLALYSGATLQSDYLMQNLQIPCQDGDMQLFFFPEHRFQIHIEKKMCTAVYPANVEYYLKTIGNV